MAIPVLALWGLSGPAVQVLMTRRVAAFEQGQLQGANASLTGISELAGPVVFSLTFAYFVQAGQPIERSGAPFILGAALLFVACLIGWWTTRRSLPLPGRRAQEGAIADATPPACSAEKKAG
jgi:DHA1 family tetracycline resistance protein-like MFS transporter